MCANAGFALGPCESLLTCCCLCVPIPQHILRWSPWLVPPCCPCNGAHPDSVFKSPLQGLVSFTLTGFICQSSLFRACLQHSCVGLTRNGSCIWSHHKIFRSCSVSEPVPQQISGLHRLLRVSSLLAVRSTGHPSLTFPKSTQV